MLKSKIHRATVTQADLHYVGSLTVDADLMGAAYLLPGEQVHVVDINNGARLETYVIEGPHGSGVIGINGAAARLVHPGDLSSSSATRPSMTPRPGHSCLAWSMSTRAITYLAPGRTQRSRCRTRQPCVATRCAPGYRARLAAGTLRSACAGRLVHCGRQRP